eukprot:tig00000903_g5517.t1
MSAWQSSCLAFFANGVVDSAVTCGADREARRDSRAAKLEEPEVAARAYRSGRRADESEAQGNLVAGVQNHIAAALLYLQAAEAASCDGRVADSLKVLAYGHAQRAQNLKRRVELFVEAERRRAAAQGAGTRAVTVTSGIRVEDPQFVLSASVSLTMPGVPSTSPAPPAASAFLHVAAAGSAGPAAEAAADEELLIEWAGPAAAAPEAAEAEAAGAPWGRFIQAANRLLAAIPPLYRAPARAGPPPAAGPAPARPRSRAGPAAGEVARLRGALAEAEGRLAALGGEHAALLAERQRQRDALRASVLEFRRRSGPGRGEVAAQAASMQALPSPAASVASLAPAAAQDPRARRAGGGARAGALEARVRELEAERAELLKRNRAQEETIRRYREKWEQLKENARRRKAGGAAAGPEGPPGLPGPSTSAPPAAPATSAPGAAPAAPRP